MQEIVKKSERIYEGKIIHVRKDEAVVQGKSVLREVVEHPGGVAVLAIDQKKRVVCVRQYRYAQKKELLEVPAGKREENEDPLTTGQRELHEETGILAANWFFLGEFIPTGAYLEEKIWMYLAWDLTMDKTQWDEDEWLSIEWIPLDELIEQVMDGTITDGKTIAMVLKTARLIETRQGPFQKEDAIWKSR